MKSSTCAALDELRAYLVGELSDEESQRVADHIKACSHCQSQVTTIDDGDDTLISQLRSPRAEDSFSQESACQLAMVRAMSAAAAALEEEPASSALLTDSQLGEYRLLELVGRGGMGTVYRALHTKLDREVAIKVLPRGRWEDERSLERFEREMKAIGRLDHPSIVAARDAREIDGVPVLIMEYVDGVDVGELADRLSQLPIADACEIARRTALALQYAHENGLIHRDIKPSNIMLSRQGEVKLLDLGLALLQAKEPSDPRLTNTAQAMGTADYIAPEQVTDSSNVDIRADVYSLGCTLYRLLSGHAPFDGTEYRGKFDKMTAHVSHAVPPVGSFGVRIPEKLAALIHRMLAKSPGARPSTSGEVAAELEVFCDGADLCQLVEEAERVAPRKSTDPAAPLSGELPARRLLSRRIPVPAAAGLMLIAGFIGFALGIVITIQHPDGSQTSTEMAKGSQASIDKNGNISVTPPFPDSADAASASNTANATKTVYMPAGDTENKNVILDLASGDMLPATDLTPTAFTLISKGDFGYDRIQGLVCLRGGRAMIWNKDLFVPLELREQKDNYVVYKFPSVPCRLLVTTAEKRQFDVTVLAETKDGGIVLEYHVAADEVSARAAATVTDHERLQGVWKMSSAKNNGRALPKMNAQIVFKSGLYKMFEDGKQKDFGTYTIDPSQTPKTIDLQDASKISRPMFPFIYEFFGEGRLRICGGDNKEGHPTFRPTNFDSVPGIDNLIVMEFRLETKDASAVLKSSARDAGGQAETGVSPSKAQPADTADASNRAKVAETGGLEVEQEPPRVSNDGPKTSSVALRRLPAKGNVLRWRVEPVKGVRILQGTVGIIGNRDGSKSFIGPQDVGGRRLTHSHPFELRVKTRREGRYLWITTTLGDSHRNKGTAVESKFDFPRGSRMQIVPWNARGDWSKAPRLTSDEYANLWEARFVRDGKVVRSYVFVARLIGEDETASTTPFQPRLPAASAMPAADPTAPATRVLAEVEKKAPAGGASSGDAENKAPPAKPDKVSNKPTKKAHLRNAEGGPGATVGDFLGVQFVLDLASGKMLAFPDNVFKDPGKSIPLFQHFTNQGLGDLIYAGHSLFCLRGAKAMLWDGNGFIPMQQGDFARSSKRTKNLTRYELTKFPCRLLITTAEKKQFDVTVLPMTEDGGIDLEYRLAVTEAPAGPAATVTDHVRLHGVWKVLSVKKNSHALPEIDGQYVFQSGRFKIFDDGKEAVVGTFEIDPSPNPKTIDLHDVSKLKLPTLLAIYEFPSEGRLRISYGDNKTGRPTSFDAKRGIGNFAVLELRLQTKDASAVPKSSDRKPLTPVKPDESSDESNKKAHLPNAAGDPGTKLDDEDSQR